MGKKKEETSSKCSGGTNFGIDPNERYIKKGDILSLVGKNCPRDIHRGSVASSSLCTDAYDHISFVEIWS